MKRNLLYAILFLFTSLFVFAPVASATEIVLDTEHHHLGDDFKEELNPSNPEGLVYTATFTLNSSVNIESAEFTLTGKSIFSGSTDEFSDKVYLNEIEIGSLNDYIPAGTPDFDPVNITIPVHPSLFDRGTNTIKISSGSNANGSNYDDFEFYDLSLHLIETEAVTLAPPLKVAWTYELPWRLPDEKPDVEILATDEIVYLCKDYEEGILAVDTETGELIWNKEAEWGADMEYSDGVLFALHSSNIDALDAKTGELLWNREYQDIWWGNPLVFGNTLFVSTPDDRYVAAIDSENGSLKWEYGINITDFRTEARSSFQILDPSVNGNVLVFRYYSPYSISTGSDKGLIALDAKTGKEVWRYTYLGFYSYDPCLYKDLVYIEDHGDIIALSAESGEIAWKTKVSEFADVVEVKNNEVLVDSGKPVVLNANTGEILKELPYSELSLSSSVITDKYVYSTGEHDIKVLNSSTGETVWSSSRIEGTVVSDPTLYKDKLYLVSSEGVLYAFEQGEEELIFTRGLENSAIFYFPPIAIAGMLILLAKILKKSNNEPLVFGAWLITLAGVLLLSLKIIDPYIYAWSIPGFLAFFTFWSLPVILLIGIVFLVSGILKRKK